MEKSLTKNSIFYLIYNLLNVLFPFLTGIYVARILSPAYIGQVETARNLATYFVIFSFLGIPTYGLREISKARNDKKELNRLYTELMIINTISTTFFLVLYIIVIFNVPSYRTNIVYFLITGFSIALNFLNNSWLFEGLEKFDYISIRNFVFKFISLLLLVLFVRNNGDSLTYTLITVVGTAGNYVLNIISSKKYVKLAFEGINLRRHMKSILYLVVVNLAIEIYSLVDITMLGLMCEKEVVTYYSYGVKIQKILLEIVNTFTMVLVPRIALYYEEKKMDDFNFLLTKTLSIILILSLPMIVGIHFVGSPLITKIYGDNYIRSALVLKVLSFSLFVSPIGYLLGSRVMLVTGHENKMVIAVAMGAISNIVGNAILIPVLYENGAALASILSEIVVAIIYVFLSHKYFCLNKELLINTLYKLTFGLFAIIGFLYLFRRSNYFSILTIFIQIIISSALYFFVLILFKEPTVYVYYIKFLRRLGWNK